MIDNPTKVDEGVTQVQETPFGRVPKLNSTPFDTGLQGNVVALWRVVSDCQLLGTPKNTFVGNRSVSKYIILCF